MSKPKKLSVGLTFRGDRVDRLLAWAKADQKAYTTVADSIYTEGEALRLAREKAARLGTAEARLGDQLVESQPSAPESTSCLGAHQATSIETPPVDSPAGTPESRLGGCLVESHPATSHPVASDADSPAASRTASDHLGESQAIDSVQPSRLVAPPPSDPPEPTALAAKTEDVAPLRTEPQTELPEPAAVVSPPVKRIKTLALDTLHRLTKARLRDRLAAPQRRGKQSTSRLGGAPIAVGAVLTAAGLLITVATYRRISTPVAPPVSAAAPALSVASATPSGSAAAPALPAASPAPAAAPAVPTLVTNEKDIEAALDIIKHATVEILWITNAPDARIIDRIAAAKRSAPKLTVTIVTDDVRAGQRLADGEYRVFACTTPLHAISWLAVDKRILLDATSRHGVVSITGEYAVDQLWDLLAVSAVNRLQPRTDQSGARKN